MPKNKQNLHVGFVPDPETAKQGLRILLTFLNREARTTWRTGQRRKRIVLLLRSDQVALRLLVEKWRRTGPNLRKLFEQEPMLAKAAQEIRLFVWPSDGGAVYIDWPEIPQEEHKAASPEVIASRFMLLVANSHWELLGGPCVECDDYFIKTKDRPQRFCKARCASKNSARRSQAKRRDTEHQKSISAMRQWIVRYSERRRRQQWKSWVAQQMKVPENRVTRALNCGEIQAPLQPVAPRIISRFD